MKCEEALTTPSTDMHPHDPDDVLPTCEQAATYRLTSGTVVMLLCRKHAQPLIAEGRNCVKLRSWERSAS
mgnify:CR=1 FL=1